MKKQPLVSIIIPVYNYQMFIRDCIQSCLNQSYKGPIEIIMVDDKSKDRSVQVAEMMGATGIRIIKLKKNKGYSRAKNEGIIASKGELITTLDADDMMTENSIHARVKMFKKDKELQMVSGLAFLIDKKARIVDRWKLERKARISKSIKIHAQTVMIRRSVYEKYGLYDEDLRSRSDNEMWHRLINIAGIKHLRIQLPVALYRKHQQSMVQFRKKNPKYNSKVTSILHHKKFIRQVEGITKKNTRFM